MTEIYVQLYRNLWKYFLSLSKIHVTVITKETFPVGKTTGFLYKQPVYKQLAIGWKIAKQLTGLNSLSQRNDKN